MANLSREEWKELYDGVTQTNYEWVKPIMDIVEPGMRTLELGSGSRTASFMLSALGVDAKTCDFALPADYDFDVLEDWPEIGEFDIIFSIGLLEHFEDDAVVEILKRCKKAGKTIISLVPNGNSVGYISWRRDLEGKGKWNYKDEKARKTMKDLFKRAGLKSIKESACGNDFLDNAYLLVTIGKS